MPTKLTPDPTFRDAQAAGDAAYDALDGTLGEKSIAYTKAYAALMATIEKDTFARRFFERAARGDAEVVRFTGHRCPECGAIIPTGDRCAHCGGE